MGLRAKICMASAVVVTLSVATAVTAPRSEPVRAVKIVVPFPPGGAADILARLLADQLGRTGAMNIQIENRPGAGSVVGTEAVARATPDGNTILVTANSFIINPILRKVSYEPFKSFDPLCLVASTPQVIAVNGASAYQTLEDLVKAARSKPGELTLASVGPATAQHIAFELLKRAASVNMTHVPFPGGGPAVNALLGNHVTAVLANVPEMDQQVRAGQLRALAVTAPRRLAHWPTVPAVAEAGFPGFEAATWIGLVAPATSPKHRLDQMTDGIRAAMQVPDVAVKLAVLGLDLIGMCGADFSIYLRKQYQEYSAIIREANIRPE
jgi:tripartite-type tricarboxylate transporter receptor subunit TctC